MQVATSLLDDSNWSWYIGNSTQHAKEVVFSMVKYAMKMNIESIEFNRIQ